MNLKFCGCKGCKAGRKKGNNPSMIDGVKRSARRTAKRLLKNGEFDNIPNKVSVPYTD